MGSMISLAVGRLEIDWGKYDRFCDHSALFQPSDLTQIPYYYAGFGKLTTAIEQDWGITTVLKDGLSKPLAQVVERINLLGHTSAVCEKEFASLATFYGIDVEAFPYSALQQALATVDVNSISPSYGEGGEDIGDFFRREIFDRIRLDDIVTDPEETKFDVNDAMGKLSAYSILHLLAANPIARELNVQWAFNDVEDFGYDVFGDEVEVEDFGYKCDYKRDYVRPVDQSARFLIVTEGSSDAAIIRHAFHLLKPHIADFFDFVDMQEGYPFSGTGNVFRFVQGLIGIRVMNNVLIVYDNDAEGIANLNRTNALRLPPNMRAIKLPDLRCFEKFPTVGPNGEHDANINGRAAAIEAYLHLHDDACVRWSSFNEKAGAYQGALIGKEQYTREFLDQRKRAPEYNFDNVAAVLDSIIENAIAMREASTIAKTFPAYGNR